MHQLAKYGLCTPCWTVTSALTVAVDRAGYRGGGGARNTPVPVSSASVGDHPPGAGPRDTCQGRVRQSHRRQVLEQTWGGALKE